MGWQENVISSSNGGRALVKPYIQPDGRGGYAGSLMAEMKHNLRC